MLTLCVVWSPIRASDIRHNIVRVYTILDAHTVGLNSGSGADCEG